jgi:hypothetical protein
LIAPILVVNDLRQQSRLRSSRNVAVTLILSRRAAFTANAAPGKRRCVKVL